ncbi:MAG: hypothetical protein E4H20_04145, partial [Spirochaetales bacterium]
MITVAGFAFASAASVRNFFFEQERLMLSRSAVFLTNQLADRLDLFASYTDDAFRGTRPAAPFDISLGLIVSAHDLSVVEVLPSERSGEFFVGYSLANSAPGKILSGIGDGQRIHTGVIRSPEWDGPALYYAERRGDRIVVCVSGIEAIARVLSHVSDISSGG